MVQQILGAPTWTGVVAEDVEKLRRFYRDSLGLREIKAGDGFVQFDLTPPYVFEIMSKSARPGYQNATFQIGFNVENIETARAELIARGVKAVGEIDGGLNSGAYWCFFEDAEGNVFALLQMLS